jgi:flagellar biosynthesis protein FliP
MLTSTPGAGGSQTYTLSIQTLLTLTALTFLPAALLMMTSFTRIIIVLSLLRHALGTQNLAAESGADRSSLFLTFFIMSPVLDTVYSEAYLPLSETGSATSKPSSAARCHCESSCSNRRVRPISPFSPPDQDRQTFSRPTTFRCAC